MCLQMNYMLQYSPKPAVIVDYAITLCYDTNPSVKYIPEESICTVGVIKRKKTISVEIECECVSLHLHCKWIYIKGIVIISTNDSYTVELVGLSVKLILLVPPPDVDGLSTCSARKNAPEKPIRNTR